MKISNKEIHQLDPDAGIHVGDGRNSKSKRKELQETKRVAKKRTRTKLNRLLDEKINNEY